MFTSGWKGYGAATLCLHVSAYGEHGIYITYGEILDVQVWYRRSMSICVMFLMR